MMAVLYVGNMGSWILGLKENLPFCKCLYVKSFNPSSSQNGRFSLYFKGAFHIIHWIVWWRIADNRRNRRWGDEHPTDPTETAPKKNWLKKRTAERRVPVAGFLVVLDGTSEASGANFPKRWDEVGCITLWLCNIAMVFRWPIEIDGLPFAIKWVDFPWRTVSHNQMGQVLRFTS